MKRIAVTVLLVCLVMAGCASVNSIKDPSLVDPMGIVSVYADQDITWYGEEPQEDQGFNLLGKLVDKAVEASGNEELSKLMARTDFLVDEAEAILYKKLETVDTVKLLSRDEVLSSKTYKAVKKDSMVELSNLITADDYKYIKTNDAAFSKAMFNETGLKGNILANFKFQRLMKSGIAKNGEMGAAVTMSIIIVDEQGKMLFSKSYFGKSKESLGVIGGMYDIDQFIELFPGVVSELCDKFVAEF